MFALLCDTDWTFNGTDWICTGTQSSGVLPSSTPFDVSTLDPGIIAEAMLAGFVIAAIPMITAHLSRFVISNINRRH